MLPSAALIFNPVAGPGHSSDRDLTQIKTALRNHFDLQVHLTSPDVSAEQLAHEAVEQRQEIIIASGGDGTVSAVATALIGTQIPLGIISRGTANALAKAIGIPTNIAEACQTILQGKTRTIDTALCNGKPVVLLAGIGLEAEAIEHADRDLKNQWGMFAYILAGIDRLRKLNQFAVTIKTDTDEVRVFTATSVIIANAAPPLSILAQGPDQVITDDGLLDITIVAPENHIDAIAASYELFKTALNKTPAEQEAISYLRAKHVKVVTHPPQKVALDGEVDGETPIEIECVPQGLTLLVPDSEKQT